MLGVSSLRSTRDAKDLFSMTALTSVHSLYRTAPDLVTRKVGDEAVLVPIRNRVGDLESVFTLNEVALKVWTMLDGKTPVATIVNAVCDEYDVGPVEAEADAAELLGRLLESKLIEEVTA